jgi:hypothetical protein
LNRVFTTDFSRKVFYCEIIINTWSWLSEFSLATSVHAVEIVFLDWDYFVIVHIFAFAHALLSKVMA